LLTDALLFVYRSRKRRPSSGNGSPSDENNQDCMNECTAALVLMSLSCSPHSPRPYYVDGEYMLFLLLSYKFAPK
jgi:hypothetical protein